MVLGVEWLSKTSQVELRAVEDGIYICQQAACPKGTTT